MTPDQVGKLFEKIPRKSLLFLPTPLDKLENLSAKYGVDIYVKRDDMTGPSPYGGNKMRNIEFILGAGLANGIEYFISTGGYQTNSGMELTQCCRKCGLKTILYLRDTLREGIPSEYRGNLLLNKIMGCYVHYVERPLGESRRATQVRCLELMAKKKEELEQQGHKAMVLPSGVVASEGWVAYVLAFKEIIEQSQQMDVKLDYLFHSTGSGGSLPGMLAGKFLLNSDVKIISIAVAPPPVSADQYVIRDRAEEVFRRLGVEAPHREAIFNEINIDWHFYGEDYAVPSQEASETIMELAREEGLFVDPVYSGKGFAGFLEYIRSGKVLKGSQAAFLHTGGAGALFAGEGFTGKIWDD